MTTIDLTNVLALAGEIHQERVRQHAEFGEQNHPDGSPDNWWVLAEGARDSCQLASAENRVTWVHILREEVYEAFAAADPVEKRGELVQVAAVAAAWIEAIDRRSTAEAEDRPDLVDELFAQQLGDQRETPTPGSPEWHNEIDAALDEVRRNVDHGEAIHNPWALQALRLAEQLQGQLAAVQADFDRLWKSHTVAADRLYDALEANDAMRPVVAAAEAWRAQFAEEGGERRFPRKARLIAAVDAWREAKRGDTPAAADHDQGETPKPLDSNDDAPPSTQDTPQAAETAPVVHPVAPRPITPVSWGPATDAPPHTGSAPTDAPALAGLDEAIVAGFHAITDDDHTVTESGLAAIAVRAAYPVIHRAVLAAAARDLVVDYAGEQSIKEYGDWLIERAERRPS